MSQHSLAFNPLWWQWADLPAAQREVIYDDALIHRQRLESMDWYPVLESFDEYQIRVWQELEL